MDADNYTPTAMAAPLGGRYQIIRRLGAGSFGQTFLATDLHLPGQPQCVVKQLRPVIKTEKSLQTARRLFKTEATVLAKLGEHDNIPRLLAHFEDGEEFYLVQALVEGEDLDAELAIGERWNEEDAIAFLQDLLSTLTFVHGHQVIHRDIKPSNLIRRQPDRRIVLIDFGAVKQVGTQLVHLTASSSSQSGPVSSSYGPAQTIAIGTDGYMSPEQIAGRPRFNSDIYAAGMVAIQGLTGQNPRTLNYSRDSEVLDWHHLSPQASPALLIAIDKMVHSDFRARYASASQALAALAALSSPTASSPAPAPSPPPPSPPPISSSTLSSQASFVSTPVRKTSSTKTPSPSTASQDSTVSDSVESNLIDGRENTSGKETASSRAKKFLLFVGMGLTIAAMLGLGALTGQNLPTWIARFNSGSTVSGGSSSEPSDGKEPVVDQKVLEAEDAIASLERLYDYLSTKEWGQAAQIISPDISERFRPEFFQKFKRVTVENLQITAQTDDAIELIGQNTYVYSDGSFQIEERTYTMRLLDGEPYVVESELSQVIQPR